MVVVSVIVDDSGKVADATVKGFDLGLLVVLVEQRLRGVAEGGQVDLVDLDAVVQHLSLIHI